MVFMSLLMWYATGWAEMIPIPEEEVAVHKETQNKRLEAETWSVKLQSIEAIRPQEYWGDELYISVTEFPEQGVPSRYQIPHYPGHWLSDYLKKVQGVTLWKKRWDQCKNVQIIFSLVEEDLEPWDLDDLLGSVELRLRCENGKVKAQWLIPDKENTVRLEDQDGSFLFSGKKYEYRAKLLFNEGLDRKKIE